MPGFGMVAASGLSGTNCLLAHVSTIKMIKIKFQQALIFELCLSL
ncbi:hypothetical protein LFAB_11515 [Lactiplantibacillus fabifermentans T30PCM01]|uniref:Uncharacterized protein n=1 Tax=Lactiplantibacillus fabifermentans T30PCM01 TaxID=1400520 RepID=W6TC17_9LACO|nr:hypothetical protein LFAB_11515 [Lactiplantibacillus fabifermentans T30PCM01]